MFFNESSISVEQQYSTCSKSSKPEVSLSVHFYSSFAHHVFSIHQLSSHQPHVFQRFRRFSGCGQQRCGKNTNSNFSSQPPSSSMHQSQQRNVTFTPPPEPTTPQHEERNIRTEESHEISQTLQALRQLYLQSTAIDSDRINRPST